MSVSWFTLNIPNKENYNLKEVITLFFHEMSHFIRMYNTFTNLGIEYTFYNNYELEEGIAIYNEHHYWNQIIDYGEYYPWYDKIYNILFRDDLTNLQKEEMMFHILHFRWVNESKTKKYFQRFYRYSPLWWTELFLKESIYSRSLKRVQSLVEEGYTISYLMRVKWNIDVIKELTERYNIKENSIHEEYFDIIKNKIINMIK